MPLKKGVRILAIDDSSFSKDDKSALVVGVVGRESIIEGIVSFRVRVDGSDATRKIIEKVKRSRFANQIKIIAIHGVTLAGLNLVDIIELNKKLRVAIVSVLRAKPHRGELEKAMRASGAKDYKEKISTLRKIHKESETFRIKSFYIQCVGISKTEVTGIYENTVGFLRLAHLVANGIARGESKGRM